MSHRNIGRMYELMEEEGKPFITMEFVSGEDLKSFIRQKGKLAEGEAIAIAKQVCEGLAEAHELGVIHRDLKPQNIMIGEKNNVKVMDFGIARSVEAPGVTATGMIIGTPDYISPEQAEGKEADQRSDIYALGVILYEMVTGDVPFKGDTALSVALKHKTQLPQDPKKLNPEVSEELSRLILICMEKERERRYHTAEALLDDLRNIEEGFPLGTKIRPRRETFVTALIRKKLFIPVMVVALVIIAAVIWQLLLRKDVVPIPSDKSSIAILYFENNSGDESLDIWRSGISELLITDLIQSKFIKVLPGDRVYSILKKLNLLDARKYSTEDLIRMADEGRANHTISGSFIKAGDNIVVTVLLQKPHTGEIINSLKVECRGEEEIVAKVDELTRQIKRDLNLAQEQIASDIDLNVGKITTSSPEAYKYYSNGIKYNWRGDFRQSIQFMGRAVALDPEFASAYRVMAVAYGNLGYSTEWRKYLQKAFELSDRVSERERYRIQADFYRMSEKTYDKAIEAYNKLLELYPEDHIGNNNLGVLYRRLEEWDKAIERFEVGIQIETDPRIEYSNQAGSYRAKGMYDRAREVLEDYLINFSDHASIHNNLALNHLCQGKYDLALVEVDKALSLSLAYYYIRMKGDIYHCKGDLTKAENDYKELLEKEEQAAHLWGRNKLGALYLLKGKFEDSREQHKKGADLAEKLSEKEWKGGYHFDLAYSYLKSGNPKQALDECNTAWSSFDEIEDLYSQRFTLHYKGLAYLEMGLLKEAQRAADELKVMIEEGLNKKHFRYYYHLVGMIELERKNLSIYGILQCSCDIY
ncbi:MAG: protein kinase [Candidatus Hodarchaeota archaeon]